jgi:hypothetical protein
MNSAAKKRILGATGALFSITFTALVGARSALAQARDEYGDVNQTVARISYISGSVSFARGDDPDNWQAADQNVPMSLGDRVYTDSKSRAELQVQGGDSIWLGARTDLAALNLTDDTKQFSVKGGVATFQIQRLGDNEIFEVDTPNAAVTFDQNGNYRIEVDNDGNTRVVVWRGRAVVAAGGGQVAVNRGEEMRIDGMDSPRYDVVAAAARDGWDQWADGRLARVGRSRSYEYVSADVVGAADLDDSGRWENIPDYGQAWTPASVGTDWAPYRVGHWIWQDPWGWTWVSTESWGWAPYHYGRWVNWSSRWYWVPVASSVRYVTYSPALVAFVGGGPGFSASVTVGGGGFVGWFPLAPRDPFNPWWGRRAANVNVTNVTYVNKTYVTVVNQNTFVSGGVVTSNIVRDRTVLNNVAAAQVVRGPIPMVPTRESLRVSVRANQAAAVRPPATVVARSVVVHNAPPPAPPSFQAKVAVIRENHGAPIEPAAAAKISISDRGRTQAVTNVRAAAGESGRMTLAPSNASTSAAAHQAAPVAPIRGRAVATAQQPVAAAPAPRASPPSGAQGNVSTTEQDRGRSASDHASPATSDSGPARNQDWRSRQQPTPVPRGVMPSSGDSQTKSRENTTTSQGDRTVSQQGRRQEVATPAPKPSPQGNTQGRSLDTGRSQPDRSVDQQGRRREFPTAVPSPPPQGNTQGSGRSSDGARSQPDRSVDQQGRRREVATPVPQPPARMEQQQTRDRSSAGPPPKAQPEAERGGRPPATPAAQRGRPQEKKPPEKEKTKKPDEH